MRSYIKDGLIIVSVTIAMLLLAEGLFRAIFPEKVVIEDLPSPIAYEFNSEYIVSLKPNMDKEYQRAAINGGYITRWKSNADSFRGAPLNEDPDYRILVYGDSNIQARFSGTEKSYTGQLAAALDKQGYANAEVINAGVVGAGPDQNMIRMEADIGKYRPDLVVFHIFADNDFGDLIRNRLFDLGHDGDLLRTSHEITVDDWIRLNEREKKKDGISDLLTVRAFRKLVAAFSGTEANPPEAAESPAPNVGEESVEDLMTQLSDVLEEEFAVYKAAEPRKFSHFADHYDMDVAIDPDRESSRVKIRLMDGVIRQANELARSQGAEFLVLIQPSAKDMTIPNSNFGYDFLEKYPSYRRTNLTDSVESICVRGNVDFVNLYPLFDRNSPEELFFEGGDDHWNDRGQLLAARYTAEYIAARDLLRPDKATVVNIQ